MNEYKAARKKGQRRYQEDLKKGVSPYPKVLDEVIGDRPVAGRSELGLFDLPMNRIIGTATAGRRAAFSTDFMPLLEPDTEFGMKWVSLCHAHLNEGGIRDAIRCYEYLGDFYVQEGNKRVSVLKHFDAPTIASSVLRIVPAWSEEPQIRLYYEFMEFFRRSRLYTFRFQKFGKYRELTEKLGFAPDAVWDADDRLRVQNAFARFCKAAETRLPQNADLNEAFLAWVSTYTIDEMRTMTEEALSASITALAADLAASVAVETETKPVEKSVLTRLYDAVFLPDHLNAAFVHEFSPAQSDWVAAHEEGRLAAERELDGKVTTKAYVVTPEKTADDRIAEAVKDGAQVIFATTPSLITACRRAAATYPQVKILNCSVIMPYPGVRTYYSRIYEAKFISGAIAGAMTKTGKLGYIASSPIFGVPAGINAFALGARMTNPRARVSLHWSSVETDPLSALMAEGVDIISNRDLPMPSRPQAHWGLNQITENKGFTPLAAPYWNWGGFYGKLLREILAGQWEDNSFRSGAQAVNYWWGMPSGVVDLVLSEDLPEGVRTLALLLKRELSGESLLPFFRKITAQDGTVVSDGTRLFTPQEILEMDWLCDAVDGEIPPFEKILPMAQSIVRLEGVYRDALKPKEEPVS